MNRFLIALALFPLSACSMFGEAPVTSPAAAPSAQYTQVSFTDLPGYASDTLMAALPALRASCQRLGAIPADRSLGVDGHMGRAGDWQPFCQSLASARDEASLRAVVQTQLKPWSVSDNGNADGLFTGYYESELRGSLTQHDQYQTPLYQRPADLIMVDLGEFRDELKGQRIAGRAVNGQLKPYEDRSQIVNGKISSTPLVWLDDKIDAFFVQIQGSGRIELDNGQELRVGYDGQNGHIYTAIGKALIARGALTPETVSMQTIRDWLKANPTEADTLMNSNRSYVFFRASDNVNGPQGAANVALTPLRSLAVDNRFVGYHVPVWLATDTIRQLVVAQDTGGAIKGAVRGDLFWGHGSAAESSAGQMKSRGRYFVLLPVAINPQ